MKGRKREQVSERVTVREGDERVRVSEKGKKKWRERMKERWGKEREREREIGRAAWRGRVVRFV